MGLNQGLMVKIKSRIHPSNISSKNSQGCKTNWQHQEFTLQCKALIRKVRMVKRCTGLPGGRMYIVTILSLRMDTSIYLVLDISGASCALLCALKIFTGASLSKVMVSSGDVRLMTILNI